MGMGPMTGRAAGYCAGYGVPGYMNPIPGRGYGMGFGRGLGLGFRGGFRLGGYAGVPYTVPAYPYGSAVPQFGAAYAPAIDPQQEADMLKGQVEYFEDALAGIKKRLADLESEDSGKK